MTDLVLYPNTILDERMPDFDFNNPIMDPKDLEIELLSVMYSSPNVYKLFKNVSKIDFKKINDI